MTPATNKALRLATPLTVPQISQDELFAFHQSHFSAQALAEFGHDFMNQTAATAAVSHASHVTQADCECQEGHQEEEEEEDDLGYYEDGVRRTLTDEQIAIFRHSEMRELQRDLEKTAHAKTGSLLDESANDSNSAHPQESGSSQLSNVRSSNKKKKKNVSKKEPKPDLRKRTWDVVEAGLDSLDYD